MHSTIQKQPSALSIEARAAELLQQGFRPGTPARVSPLARQIDATVYAEAECGGCGNAGQDCRPYQNDQGGYRILAVCSGCGEAEEF